MNVDIKSHANQHVTYEERNSMLRIWRACCCIHSNYERGINKSWKNSHIANR